MPGNINTYPGGTGQRPQTPLVKLDVGHNSAVIGDGRSHTRGERTDRQWRNRCRNLGDTRKGVSRSGDRSDGLQLHLQAPRLTARPAGDRFSLWCHRSRSERRTAWPSMTQNRGPTGLKDS